MNQDLINKAIARAKDGEIDLGCANGWMNETNEIYKMLSQSKVPDTSTHEYIGRCYSEYTFVTELEGNHYKVVYTVDSGD
jgi:hypothetical protein